MGLSSWLSGKEATCQCRRCMFNSGLGRSPGGGNGYPLQYSCFENPMDREVWRATVPGGCKELHTTSDWAWTHDSFQHLCLFAWASIILVSIWCCSVVQSCLTLCSTKDCSTPGFPVHHQFPEPARTHLHWVGDAIQPSHSLSSPSPPALNLSQLQGLFKWVSSSHTVFKLH